MAVYNMSKIKEWYDDFNSCKGNYLNTYYQSYKSSYIITNSDSAVDKMQNKLDAYYSKLKNAYSKVGSQWENLYYDLINADSALSGEKSSGSVNASSAVAKINSMPKLVEYKNALSGNFAATGAVTAAIAGANSVAVASSQDLTAVTKSVEEATKNSGSSKIAKTLGGAATGAVIGASIASIVPGIGTVVGGAIGAGVGAVVSSGIASKIKDWFKGVGETIKETAINVKEKVGSIVEEVEQADGIFEKVKIIGSGAVDVGKKLAATGATIVTSVVEGLGKLVEDVVDLVALVGTVVLSVGTGALDLANMAAAKITKDDSYKSDYTKRMWNGTRSFVANDFVGNAFDKFYENTPVGSWIKDNAIAFDTVRAVTKEVSEVLGVIAITVVTAGAGGAALGTASSVGAGISAAAASTAVTSTGAAITYGAVKTAEHTESNWQDENVSTFKGLTKGVLQGVADGAFFAIGAKGDQALRSSATTIAQSLGKDATKEAIKAAQREATKKLGLKMAFEGGTSIAQDLGTIGLDALFSNDTVVDANGNTIKLNSMSEKLKYYYEQAGGAQSLAQSVMTAVVLSSISDRSDSIKIVNDAVKSGEKSSFKQALHNSKLKTSYKLDQLKASANLKLTSGAIALTGKTIDLGKAIKNFAGDTMSKVKNKIDSSAVKQKVGDSLSEVKKKLHSTNLKTSYKLDQLKASANLKLTSGAIALTGKTIDLGKTIKNFAGDTMSKLKNKIDNSAVKQKVSDSLSNSKINLKKVSNVISGIASNGAEFTKNKIKNINSNIIEKINNKSLKLSTKLTTLAGSTIGLKSKLKSSFDKLKVSKQNLKSTISANLSQTKQKLKNINVSFTNKLKNGKITTKLETLAGSALGLKQKLKNSYDDAIERIKNSRISKNTEVSSGEFKIVQDIVGGAAADDNVLKQVDDINVKKVIDDHQMGLKVSHRINNAAKQNIDPISFRELDLFDGIYDGMVKKYGRTNANKRIKLALEGDSRYITRENGFRMAFDSISTENKNIIKILVENNDVIYCGKKTVLFGSNSTQLDCMSFYNNRCNVTINVQSDYNSLNVKGRNSVQDYLNSFNRIAEKQPNLVENINEINITDIRNPDDAYWAKQVNANDFKSAATGGRGVINLYKFMSSGEKNIDSTLVHEMAHTVDKNSALSNLPSWEKAYNKDGKGGITAYATKSTNRPVNKYAEDFADSVAKLYINGPDWFKANYPNRADLLYSIFPSLF